MRKIIASLLGPLLLSACASLSGSSPALPWDAQVVRGQLANGLEYRLLREASQVGRIDVRLTVKAGSVDETDDQVGVAHLVEHLNFYSQGPESRTVRQQMEQWGWVQGLHYNAVTNYDRTQYLLSPAAGAKQTEQALQALAILMFAANYSAADLERERPIVVEEWRGGLGVAQRMNQQRTASQRIGSRYPAHRTIGNEAAIRAATVEQLKAYQQRWYVPGNMVLSIVGDIDPLALPGLIQQWLGQAPSQALATRDQRELPLDPRLKIVQLQDSQSGGNQVALLFRLHEATSRANTQAGLRERLIDRLTLSALLTQLRQQPRVPGVRSLTVQKSQIGEYSSVLGLAAGVEGDAHPQALRQLLTEIERLRRHGFQPSDLSREQQAIRGIARRMLDQPSPRTFEQWVNDLNDATLQNRPLLPKAEIARLHLAALDGITLAELNQRFKRWSDSPDQVLQLSAPGLTPLTLPTVDQVQALRLEIANSSLDAPATASAAPLVDTTPPPLPVALAPGRVLERQGFAAQQVEHWQLSNGDRLVWLKRNGKQEQQVLLAESSAGFMAFGSLGWRNQMAAQVASQSAPPGWSEPQLQRWRKEQRVSLSLDQQAQRLQLKLSTLPSVTPAEPAPNLEGLLQAYRLSQGPLQIDRQDFDKTRADMLGRLARARDNVRVHRLNEGDVRVRVEATRELVAVEVEVRLDGESSPGTQWADLALPAAFEPAVQLRRAAVVEQGHAPGQGQPPGGTFAVWSVVVVARAEERVGADHFDLYRVLRDLVGGGGGRRGQHGQSLDAVRNLDRPFQGVHTAHRAADHRGETIDAELVCEHDLGSDLVADREVGKADAPLDAVGCRARWSGASLASAEHIGGDDKPAVGVDDPARPDHAVPPASRRVPASGFADDVAVSGECMQHEDGVIAGGREPTPGLVRESHVR